MKRAITIQNLLDSKIPTLDLDGEWYDAFGCPQSTGLWLIYAASGHGKTTFMMELIKKLSESGKVLYESYEEGLSENLKQTVKRTGLSQIRNKVQIAVDSAEDLRRRLQSSRNIRYVIIDSLDMSDFATVKQVNALVEKHPSKLFVLTAWAVGKQPAKKLSNSVLFMANQKIYVEGFRAYSKGRSMGKKGYYTIWEQGAEEYWKFK